jgi:diadenosine tetraphosphatase ApaH/serine/threonine PP2A family protein phosphatase
MRIALLSDIHSNLEALQACLRHARGEGAERFAFLGDLVGYCADPGAVIDTVAEYAAGGAVVVKGNHDQAIETNRLGTLNDGAADVLEWTRRVLTPQQREFLAGLPLTVRDGEMCFVHASADSPAAWPYVDTSQAARESIVASGATYTFSGHVHEQVLYFRTLAGKTAPFRPTSGSAVPVPPHRYWLALVGSVGQPRDGNPAAGFAIFDDASESVTFYRVPYDHVTAADKIRRVGLPAWVAHRIEQGV